MTKEEDIPHLIALCEDESEQVRAAVIQAFSELGDRLEPTLMKYAQAWEGPRKPHIRAVCKAIRVQRFEAAWTNWQAIENEHEALEDAMRWLSYLTATFGSPILPDLLEELVERFDAARVNITLPELTRFLFLTEGLGPPHGGFQDPIHSNLVEVVRRKEGLQISLSIITMLAGHRIGLNVYGFNWPRHFLMYYPVKESFYLLDPFNQGQPLPQPAVQNLKAKLKRNKQTIESYRATTIDIVMRVLRNMIVAYKQTKKLDDAAYFEQLFDKLKTEIDPGRTGRPS